MDNEKESVGPMVGPMRLGFPRVSDGFHERRQAFLLGTTMRVWLSEGFRFPPWWKTCGTDTDQHADVR